MSLPVQGATSCQATSAVQKSYLWISGTWKHLSFSIKIQRWLSSFLFAATWTFGTQPNVTKTLHKQTPLGPNFLWRELHWYKSTANEEQKIPEKQESFFLSFSPQYSNLLSCFCWGKRFTTKSLRRELRNNVCNNKIPKPSEHICGKGTVQKLCLTSLHNLFDLFTAGSADWCPLVFES